MEIEHLFGTFPGVPGNGAKSRAASRTASRILSSCFGRVSGNSTSYARSSPFPQRSRWAFSVSKSSSDVYLRRGLSLTRTCRDAEPPKSFPEEVAFTPTRTFTSMHATQ